MTIAELFIKLGLKGDAQTGKKLKGIDKGLQDIGSSSLAAKAGILAALYGLERLTGFASQIGMDLYKFGVNTGLSTEKLQKFQYAFQMVDVSAGETASTIAGLKDAIDKSKITGGLPEGLATIFEAVGVKEKDLNNTYKVMDKIIEFRKRMPNAMAVATMKRTGLFSDNFIQGAAVVDMKRDQLAKNLTVFDKEKIALKDINREWKEIWYSIQAIGTKFIAAHGMEGVEELMYAFRSFANVAEDVNSLIDRFEALKVVIIAIGVAIALYFAPITTIIAGAIAVMAEWEKKKEGKDSILFGKHSDQSRYDHGGMTGLARGGLVPDDMISAVPPSRPNSMAVPVTSLHITNHVNATGMSEHQVVNILNKHVDDQKTKFQRGH